MKRLFYSILLAAVAIAFTSCNDVETYAEQRDRELSAISSFIEREGIKVISEQQFLANDTTTDVSKNEFVLFESSGVYMQIVSRGCGEVLKKGENATVISRFTEYNVNGDSIQLSNDLALLHYRYDKFDVMNYGGSFYALFDTQHSVMYSAYGSSSVPAGWLVPLSYVKLGRLATEKDELARVRLIVPHAQGHSSANQGVYACYYTLTYQRGV